VRYRHEHTDELTFKPVGLALLALLDLRHPERILAITWAHMRTMRQSATGPLQWG
jgi:hypothetical protein